jgi:hypothetical protein
MSHEIVFSLSLKLNADHESPIMINSIKIMDQFFITGKEGKRD